MYCVRNGQIKSIRLYNKSLDEYESLKILNSNPTHVFASQNGFLFLECIGVGVITRVVTFP